MAEDWENSTYKPRPKVYITRTVPQRGVDVLLGGCNVAMWESEDTVPRGELLQSVNGVHGILCMPSDQIDKEVLDAAGPSLRAVATISADCHHIDVMECNRRGIAVLVCANQSTEGLADLIVALILLTLERSNEDGQLDNNHVSHNGKVCLQSLEHRTFGIYGLTILGHSVAKRLKDLGVSSIIASDYLYTKSSTDSDIEIVSWPELLQRSDVLCICVQNDNNPPHVFSKEVFKKMKTSAVIVDCNRGNTVSYTDLYDALRDGDISAAGINDCNQEPVPFKYPLTGLNNCVFLPQTKESGVVDFRDKVSMGMAHDLREVLCSQGAVRRDSGEY